MADGHKFLITRTAVAGLIVLLTAAHAPIAVRTQIHRTHHERLSVIQAADNMLCTDEMEIVPDADAIEATQVSETVDGACLVPAQPVNI
jgi:hypothetical protein